LLVLLCSKGNQGVLLLRSQLCQNVQGRLLFALDCLDVCRPAKGLSQPCSHVFVGEQATQAPCNSASGHLVRQHARGSLLAE
jgi:hypothetical protein